MVVPRLAAALTALVSLATVAVLYLVDARLTDIGRADLHQGGGASSVGFLVAIFASAAVGCVLLLRQPEHPVGWCFAGLATAIGLAAAAQSYGVYGVLAKPGSLPGADSAATIASAMFALWLVLLARVCSLTPTGRHLSPRWRRADHVMVVAGLVWFVTILLSPGHLESPFQDVENAWGIDGLRTPLLVVRSLTGTVNNVLVLVAAASLVVRFRRSVGEERRQLLWMAVAAVPFPALVVVAFAASKADNEALVNLAAAGLVATLPVGAGLAVSRYHLYDVDRILSRALSYLLVSALMAAAYAAVVVLVARGVGQAAGRSPLAITLATLAVVSAARPVYAAVQDAVDQRFSRRRYDALHQVRDFIAAPSSHRSVEAVLQSALADPALRVAYWVEDRGQWVTEQGLAAEADPAGLAVTRAGRQIAVVAHTSDQALARAVLDEAAPELENAGLRAAVALQLEEVRASRARIAAAQLQERRRIERDLHDGAQQRLLALAAQLQAALLNGEPHRLRTALEFGVAESRTAVLELRELANGLHPSVLSDGGLEAALEDLAGRLPITVLVDLPDHRYPEQVEATAWFVVCEAVANAVKHAGAARVDVQVADVDGALHLAVVDDGRGGADPAGRGLRGLADRTEAAGGQLLVLPGHLGGTRIEAVLPCGS